MALSRPQPNALSIDYPVASNETHSGGSWDPARRCFYKKRNLGGSFSYVRREEVREPPEGFGDRISSILAFGGARVVVFDARNLTGARDRLAKNSDSRFFRTFLCPG